MAKKAFNKKLVVSIVVSAMVAFVGGSIGLMSLWAHRDPAVYAQHATEACRAGEMIDALRAYSRAYRETLDPQWIVQAGLVAREFGDAERALRSFDKAIVARAALLPAHHGRLELRLELVRLAPSADQYANLREDAEALLALDPQDPRALLARSIALAGLVNEDPAYAEQSLSAIERAHEVAPKDIEIADTLAKRYERREPAEPRPSERRRSAPSKAEEVYRRLLEAVPESGPARLRYAQHLIRRLERRQARAAARGMPMGPKDIEGPLRDVFRLLEEAAKLDPGNGEVALAWGSYWSRAGQPDKAVEALAKAVRATPDDLRLYVELARRMLDVGQVSEARKILEQGLGRPFDRESYRGLLDRPLRHRLWCMTGQSYLQGLQPGSPKAPELLKQADEARKQAEAELGPDHWMGCRLRAQIYRASGASLAAVAYYEQADRMLDWLQRPAEKLSIQLELAALQIELTQFGPAQETLVGILRQRPGDPAALAMRSWITLTLGNARSAVVDAVQALNGLQRSGGARVFRGAFGYGNQVDPLRRTLRVCWAASFLENRSAEAARAERQLSPLTAEDRIFRAETLYRHGRADPSGRLLKEAEKAYLSVVSADPTRVEAIRRLAILYATQARRDDAVKLVRLALQALDKATTGPKASKAAVARARLVALQTELDPNLSADDRVRRSVEAASTVKDRVERAELLAECYLAADQPDKAIAELNAAAALQPDDTELLERQFMAALAAEKWELADEIRERALRLNADGAGGRLYEGRRLLAKARICRAQARETRDKDPEKAHELEEEATYWLGLALEELRSGTNEVRGHSMGRVWLAEAHEGLGQGEARGAYEMALVLNPLNVEAHRGLAKLGKAGSSEEIDVARHLRQAIRLSLKGLDGLPTDPWLHAEAQDIYERRHPKESIQRREALRQANPQDAENLLRLGFLYVGVGQPDKAEQRLQQALQAAPKDIDLHQRICSLYYLNRRHEQATKLLEDLASRLKGPARAKALLLLARHLQRVMMSLASGGSSATLRGLRDRTDQVLEEGAKIDATPALCQAGADFCLRTRRATEAVEWLRRALRIQQHKLDERPIRERLVRTLLAIRPLPDEVEREIADYDARFQGYEEVSLFWGMLHAARGELDKAVKQHTRYLERLLGAKASPHLKPGQLAEAYFLRGDLYLRMAKTRSDEGAELRRLAIADLTRARTYAPPGSQQTRYAISLALAQEQAGKGELAVRGLKAVVQNHPDATRAVRTLIEVLGRQKQWSEEKRWSEQETVIRQQMQRGRKEWLWPYLLGRVAERRKTPAEAERAYTQAAELCNYGAGGVGSDTVVQLLRTMASRNGIEDMIAVVEKHTKPEDRGFRVWTYYGMALARANRLDDARSAWTKASNAVITTARFGAISRMMQVVLGKDKALQAARQMAQAAAGNIHPRFLYAVMLDQMGRRDEAAKTIEKGRAAASQPTERVHVLTYLGTLKMLAGQGEEATGLFRQALSIDKDHMIALNNLAYLLAEDLARPKEALVHARRAAELNPDSVGVLDTLGWCLTLAGDHQKGLDVLKEAYSKQPIPPLCYHLAETYRRMERVDAAREIAEKGLKLAELAKDKVHHDKIQKLLAEIKGGA